MNAAFGDPMLAGMPGGEFDPSLYEMQGFAAPPGGGSKGKKNKGRGRGGAGCGGGGCRGSESLEDGADDPKYTTVMLRNIPNKYTRQMLIDQLHRAGFRGDIDYMYLPTDFANRCNVGYCFINLRTSGARQRFVHSFDGVAAQTCLPGFNSYKVCQVTKARWQGRDENVRRLRSGPDLMAQLAAHPEWLPLLLDEEGNQEPFHIDDSSVPVNPPGASRGRGAGTGDRKGNAGRRRGGGKGQPGDMRANPGLPGAGWYPDVADVSSYAGLGMVPMPVMTEQGLQYIPMPVVGQGDMLGMGGMPYPAFHGGYHANWLAGGESPMLDESPAGAERGFGATGKGTKGGAGGGGKQKKSSVSGSPMHMTMPASLQMHGDDEETLSF